MKSETKRKGGPCQREAHDPIGYRSPAVFRWFLLLGFWLGVQLVSCEIGMNSELYATSFNRVYGKHRCSGNL